MSKDKKPDQELTASELLMACLEGFSELEGSEVTVIYTTVDKSIAYRSNIKTDYTLIEQMVMITDRVRSRIADKWEDR